MGGLLQSPGGEDLGGDLGLSLTKRCMVVVGGQTFYTEAQTWRSCLREQSWAHGACARARGCL